MKDVMAERLKQARINAGFETAEDACRAFGWKPAGYRHHEAGVRAYDIPTALRYGKAFKINPGWLLGLDTIQGGKTEVQREPASDFVTVVGTVEAGVWREQNELAPQDRYEVEAGPARVPGADRFAVEVQGYSMDRLFQPGAVLDCIRVYSKRGRRVAPQDGQLVIVERINHDLRETTCKRLVKIEDGWELRCESTRPEFDAPFMVAKLDENLHIDDGIEVIGIVVRSIQDHFRPAK